MVRSSSSNLPLSVGNVVSVAVRLYRSHLQQYLGIALQAMLWYLALFVALFLYSIVVSVLAAGAGQTVGTLAGLLLLIPLIFFGIYCVAKTLMNTALISRLAYGDLASQPEAEKTARSQVQPKTWKFFRVGFVVGLLLFAINLGLNLLAALPIAALGAVFGADSPFIGLLSIVLNLAVLVVYYWIWARWFIPEVPLAVETIDAMDAIKRSWDLSKGAATRIFLIIVVASLITIPLYILAFLPFIFALLANLSALAYFAPGAGGVGPGIASIVVSLIISFLLLLALGVFVMPFWQAIKAVIYYDLRNRREGADLQLRGNPGR